MYSIEYFFRECNMRHHVLGVKLHTPIIFCEKPTYPKPNYINYIMNKFLKRITAVLLLAMMLSLLAFAQDDQMTQPLPIDPAVRIGKLPNGLTYYIRHNEYPKGQADFYLAQNVGSALEKDNQRGLAHFLEHMCFNGTTHFPGNAMDDWMESIGVINFNAYTGIDETVYNISSVPVARQAVQDSCLLILRDWANDLTLDPKEIDKERAVIHEEWRRSMIGSQRIGEKILPDVFPTSKYGHRLPIGTMEVVDTSLIRLSAIITRPGIVLTSRLS